MKALLTTALVALAVVALVKNTPLDEKLRFVK